MNERIRAGLKLLWYCSWVVAVGLVSLVVIALASIGGIVVTNWYQGFL